MTATPAPAPDGQALEARRVVLTAEERTLMREAAAVDAVDPYGNDGVAMCKAVEGIVTARVAAEVERAVGEAVTAFESLADEWERGAGDWRWGPGYRATWTGCASAVRDRARLVREGGNR